LPKRVPNKNGGNSEKLWKIIWGVGERYLMVFA